LGIPRQPAGQAFRARFLIVSNNKKSSNNKFTQSVVEGQSLMQIDLRPSTPLRVTDLQFTILKLSSSKINRNNIAHLAFFSLRYLRLSLLNFNSKHQEFSKSHLHIKYQIPAIKT